MHRVKKRKYPEVEEGDEVMVYTKINNFQKERDPIWSENKNKVSKIDVSHGQRFVLEGRERPLMRHEMLLIK